MIEPFGSQRDDERAGVLAVTFAQPHLKKGAKIAVKDFFPNRSQFFGGPSGVRKQSWQEQMEMLMPLVKDK